MLFLITAVMPASPAAIVAAGTTHSDADFGTELVIQSIAVALTDMFCKEDGDSGGVIGARERRGRESSRNGKEEHVPSLGLQGCLNVMQGIRCEYYTTTVVGPTASCMAQC